TGPAGSKVVPQCDEMCPAQEIAFRRENALLHPLEKDFDVSLVKEYTRPAAGCDHGNPELLRTADALELSVEYLIDTFGREDLPFGMRFTFVEDRLRAVRQDITITRLSGEPALRLFEKQIFFLITSEYKARIERSKAFEAKLHATAIEECFQRWSELLSTRDVDVESSIGRFRGQVAAVHCLKRAADPESLLMAFEFRSLMGTELFTQIFDLILSFREGNSCRFFKLLHTLPTVSLLQSACVSLLPSIRLEGLVTISKAFKSPNVKLPLGVVSRWMGYAEDNVVFLLFLDAVGIVVEEECILPSKIDVDRVEKTDMNDPILIQL
ncbi:hypothetical protein PFISCL1PPCAC_13348, partial [Pristionchus fissidentatus]